MMMTEMDIETSVYNVHLTRLIAREDFIKVNFMFYCPFRRRGSSASVVTAVGLNERRSIPERKAIVSLYHHVQLASGANPHSYSMGSVDPFLWSIATGL
jgi:hypothetical protein